MMPVISLPIRCIIITLMLLLPGTGSATDDSSGVLLRFLETEHTPLVPLLPDSFSIADDFEPSATSPAGLVLRVQGTACVYHQGRATVYKLKKNMTVFTGDTLLTGENAGLTVKMPDESILVLAAQTKLTIDRAMLKMGDVRDTALQLFFGRIRALVKKLAGEYTVWTPTVFLGVRGTDFAMAVAPAPFDRSDDESKREQSPEFLTAVLTGGHQSTVELKGRSGPPMIMKPLSVVGVRGESRADEAVYVGSAAQDVLRRIAPLPDDHPDIPPTAVPAHRPCLPFSEKIGPVRLEFFRICE